MVEQTFISSIECILFVELVQWELLRFYVMPINTCALIRIWRAVHKTDTHTKVSSKQAIVNGSEYY